MCGMSNWSYVTSTAAVSPAMVCGACCGVCPVNVTVAVCPRAVAVTVAGDGLAGTGGRYTTDCPVDPERLPGPESDQVTSFANEAGLAVIRVGPEIVWAPLGVMVRGGVSLPAQAVKSKDNTAAWNRVRIDASAKGAPRATKLSGTLLFLGSVRL